MRVRGKYLTVHYINTLHLFIHVVINITNDGIFRQNKLHARIIAKGPLRALWGPSMTQLLSPRYPHQCSQKAQSLQVSRALAEATTFARIPQQWC